MNERLAPDQYRAADECPNTVEAESSLPSRCAFYDVGRMAYPQALEHQMSLVTRCQAGEIEAALTLVEHEPVITMGAAAKKANLLISEEKLNHLGVSVVQTDRGGDVTYHGPGQIVAYPILNLRKMGLDVHSYLRKLEDVVIGTLNDYGLEGTRHGQAGVWVGERKVCSIGIAVRRSVTYHGLALNVAPNMLHFSYINPCGLDAAQVTCIADLLGGSPGMPDVASRLMGHFAAAFNVCFTDG